MTDQHQQQLQDKKLQDLFDAIDILLASQMRDQKSINSAIQQSIDLQKSITSLSENVPTQIKNATTASSDVISNTVLNRLQSVNEKAYETAHVFDQATQRLGLKMFGMGAAMLTLCFAMMWLFIMFYVPSLKEIENRRYELTYLEEAIQKLEAQGARALIINCPIDNNRTSPCIRTDERKNTYPWTTDEGKTYRLIWQGK